MPMKSIAIIKGGCLFMTAENIMITTPTNDLLLKNILTNSRIEVLRVDQLEKDPLNTEANPTDAEEEEILFADAMKSRGFFGFIVAYEIGHDKYRIESGHRRYGAAVRAGFSVLPVHITAAPKDIIERRERLMQWNLFNRKNHDPLLLAARANFLFDTYSLKNKELEEKGLETTSILDAIAMDLGCSKANVSRYRSLTALIPELKELITKGYNWSIISTASVLPKREQQMLYNDILTEDGKEKMLGHAGVTGVYIQERINRLKMLRPEARTSFAYNANDILKYLPESMHDSVTIKNAKKRTRSKDGSKRIHNTMMMIKDVLISDDYIVKESKKAETLAMLEDIQLLSEKLIKKIKEE